MRERRLDDLAMFGVVARHRSFTRAAAELGMSTSNLSHTIRRLEAALGVRLLQRNSRSVAPSASGAALLAALDPALRQIDEALDLLQTGADRVSGTLRLTATREGYEAVVRPILPRFTETYPHATIEVLIDYGFRDIIADGFDAGIRLGEKIEQDMVAIRMGGDLRMAVVASPDYLARHGMPDDPRALTGHRCINYRMVAAGSLYAWEFERAGEMLEVRVDGPLTFNEPELMLQAALEGIGIAYVLEDRAAPFVTEGRLVRLFADWTPEFPGFFLYHPSRRQARPVLGAFVAMAREG
ncbi:MULTISPECIES: LysR family transcriptional regulator [Nguyenibacter]|uniref:LysR family transcriptional regulator n=1 Tax=Nguyenibacter vanlangensis TaxID=1216886 RepID=A0A7Y7IWK0_9PROT|nr:MULTISPECIES: LysR family transcriptional regulator [Nguyenibacter]NVN11690.1 LysR family transcriptional regulator [Nguyenibacter vanlangensis]WRH89607.1 LysR family transcriptional regulator [Nguyenibacter sp. L1]